MGVNFSNKTQYIKDTQNKNLAEKFKLNVGYQDHSPPDISGFTIPVLAIGSGVRIMKNITDSRKRKGTDSEAALEPKEFKLFVNKCYEAFLAMKQLDLFKLNKEEIRYRKYSKKKVFFSKNLTKGNIISGNDLLIRQPIKKKGLFVDDIKKVIGKKLKKNVKKYQLLRKILI